jgi:hypothetical protein
MQIITVPLEGGRETMHEHYGYVVHLSLRPLREINLVLPRIP